MTPPQDAVVRQSVEPVLQPLDEVEVAAVEWLWPDRIQLGAMNVIAGDPGLGKSFVTLDMVARVSTGMPWPDLPTGKRSPGQVLLLVAEDNLADAVIPRLQAAGGEVARVHALNAVRRGGDGSNAPLSLATDIAALEQAIAEIGDVRLIVIDPIDSYLGNTDTNRNENVRTALAPLKELAERHNIAVLLVKHLNKTALQTKAVYRVTGSLAFTAFARSVWLITKDRMNPQRRLLTCVKLNNAKMPLGLAFAVCDKGSGPVVIWEDEPVDMQADDALAAEEPNARLPKAIDAAKEWARTRLADGPVESRTLFREAEEAGTAESTLRKALRAIGADKRRARGTKNPPWEWHLPEQKLGDSAKPNVPPGTNIKSRRTRRPSRSTRHVTT